ncbi:MAG: hypothetical protein ABIP48_02710 [Planctomycetota bacterium]
MPSLKNKVPKYRLHKPSGQALVQVAGQRIYLGKYGSDESRRKYDQIIGQFLAERSAGQEARFSPRPSKAQPITIAELCLAYWQHAERYYVKDGEQTDHVGVVKRALHFLNALYADEPATEFGPVKLQRLQQDLIRRKLSRVYINGLSGIIKRMFRWAASQEMLPGSVYQDLATVPGLRKGRTEARETKPVGSVADEVVEATLPYLPPVVDDRVRFQRLTGCRPSEVCLLRPGDVERSGVVWEYIPEQHKTEHHGHPRVIGDVQEASYHEQALKVSAEVLRLVNSCANVYRCRDPNAVTLEPPSHGRDFIRENWPGVKRFLPKRAPAFDAKKFCVWLRDEGIKAARLPDQVAEPTPQVTKLTPQVTKLTPKVTRRKTSRPMNRTASRCATAYKKERKIDPTIKLKHFVSSWAEDRPELSATSIYRTLLDNPDQWKDSEEVTEN